jgi:glutamate 5-kinase
MKIVVKIGTSTLAHATGRLNIKRIEQLCKNLSDLKNAGHEIILVSSGAIGMGVGKLGLSARPRDVAGKQAAAAVGQCELMYTYDKLFSEYNHTVAQILLTADDLRHDDRHQNFENTMSHLLELAVLPIINENDTVATEEIEIGDNDTLAAIVAESTRADLLILLSDIEGLYTADPHKCADAQLISDVYTLDEGILSLGGSAGSSLGTGGMATKLRAAQIVTAAGCDMVIANGADPDLLYSIAAGKAVGTKFHASKES